MKITAAILATAAYGLHLGDNNECDNKFNYEACSGKSWRDTCYGEVTPTQCGNYYKNDPDDQNEQEFWVTCEEYAEWDACNDAYGGNVDNAGNEA